jgi:hypothetical protein
MEQFFSELHEYINYHIDRLFGNSVKYKVMAQLNYMLTSHFGRMCTGALLIFLGLLIRGHYTKKMHYDSIKMDFVQPTDIFYWFALVLTSIGVLILGLYTIILFYNMIKNLFR